MPFKIAIVGAGPVGCMLARLLHLGGIDAVVYEGEPSPNYRSQGGTLDLHSDTGLAAVREAGLFDDFLQHARYDGESLLMCDEALRVLYQSGPDASHIETQKNERPEIDRSALRQLLTESLPAGMVQWGRYLKSAAMDAATQQQVVLTFADGTTATGFDLVVGAEGAWSKVRAVVSDQKPLFVGIGSHELTIPDAARTAPEISKLVNRGSVFAHATGGRKLCLQQMGDGSIHMATYMRRAEQPNQPLGQDKWYETCGYDATDLDAVRDALLREPDGRFADFAPLLRDALRKARGKTAPRSLYMLPVGFRWPHRRGVTLVGDAAHLMSPFAGEGVNTGLDDALHLARAILACKDNSADTLFRAVSAYEEEMWKRSAPITKVTDDLARTWFFTPGPVESLMPKVMTLHATFGLWRPFVPLVAASVHAYYLSSRLLTRPRVIEV